MRNRCLLHQLVLIMGIVFVHFIYWNQKSNLLENLKTFHNSSFRKRFIATTKLLSPHVLKNQSSLIVPVQNRDEQLDYFIHFLCNMSKFRDSNQYSVHFIEQQNNDKSFNRAKLLNVGLDLVINSSTCVIVHDVDLLPHNDVDYLNCELPTHLGSQLENHNWGVPYSSYSGGVFSASPKHWRQINGLSNLFQGWGGEDDEMFERFKHHNLMDALTNSPFRPPIGKGIFFKNNANHYRHDRNPQEYEMNVQILNRRMRMHNEFDKDGLGSLQYIVVNSTSIEVTKCKTHFTRVKVFI